MKKTYFKPQVQEITLHTEQALLNNSLIVSDEQTIDGGDVRSNERAWSNPIWDNDSDN